jgi:hypothetical protein
MKYQFGLTTTNAKEADVFDEFKDAARQEQTTHVAFLSHLMRLHYHWKAGNQTEVPEPASTLTDPLAIAKNMERMAIAMEEMAKTTRELLNK